MTTGATRHDPEGIARGTTVASTLDLARAGHGVVPVWHVAVPGARISHMADWITTDEATQLSGYDIQYLRRLIRAKKIAAEKKGGQYWIDRQSLLEYIEAAHTSSDKRRGARGKQ